MRVRRSIRVGRPGGGRGIRFVAVVAAGLSFCLDGGGALLGSGFRPGTKTPGPEVRLPFQALGIPGFSASFLNAGASVITVHFVDAEHLLVTFGSRGLVPRTEDDPEGDQDRMVVGELVELPSGKILSRTEWHMHDHGRYLWSLGDGRFLLRERDLLSTFAPLANYAKGHSWERVAFVHRAGELRELEVSPDNKLLILETAPRVRAVEPVPGQNARTVNVGSNGELVDRKAAYIAVDLYRLEGGVNGETPLQIHHVGAVRAAEAMRLPVDADGFLRLQNGGRKGWQVSFQDFDGKSLPLAPVGSSCPPLLQMVSSGQLLAFACRGLGGSDSLTMMAYDFAGHETWEEPIGSLPALPAFAYAPASGRFAMSRLLPVPVPNPQAPPQAAPAGPGQEVRIYQTQSGDMLLKVNTSPAIRTAENFDLSRDGTRAVVVNGSELDVYRLPELTKADREDLEDVRRALPPANSAPADLKLMVEDDAMPVPLDNAQPTALAGGGGAVAAAGAAPPASASTVAADSTAPATGGAGKPTTSGTTAGSTDTADAAGDHAVRKPPSLLKPGETPEFKGSVPK